MQQGATLAVFLPRIKNTARIVVRLSRTSDSAPCSHTGKEMCIRDRVTAGSSPTLAILRLSMTFISVDLPTFGMPMIIIRKGLVLSFRCGAKVWQRLGRRASSPGFLHDSATARTPSCRL